MGAVSARWPEDAASIIPKGQETIGDHQPSPDFSHLAFSLNNVAFAPNGLTTAPGSAYDHDTATGATSLISKTASGERYSPGGVGNPSPGEFILFPGGCIAYLLLIRRPLGIRRKNSPKRVHRWITYVVFFLAHRMGTPTLSRRCHYNASRRCTLV